MQQVFAGSVAHCLFQRGPSLDMCHFVAGLRGAGGEVGKCYDWAWLREFGQEQRGVGDGRQLRRRLISRQHVTILGWSMRGGVHTPRWTCA